MNDKSAPPKSERLARAADKAAELHTIGTYGVHPMAKLLFGWTEGKWTGAFILWGLVIASVLMLVIDYGMSRHDYFSFANATGFYALWGFGAFAFVVLMGWPLGRLLRRSPDYYGEAEGMPSDVDPELEEGDL